MKSIASKLHRPTAGIGIEQKDLERKLEKNSKKISQYTHLLKGNNEDRHIQHKIMKLQAKESFLIQTKNLKERFVIQTPEGYKGLSDIKEAKAKVYEDIQKTVVELYQKSAMDLDSRDNISIPDALNILGDNLAKLKAIAHMVKKELIPMATDGTGLKGLYGLERDLQEYISNTVQEQTALTKSISRNGRIDGTLTREQVDSLNLFCKGTKQRLSTLDSLLSLTITKEQPKINADNELTQAGISLSNSVKQSLREVLDAGYLGKSTEGNPDIANSMPFLQDIDISTACSGFRENNTSFMEKIVAELGEGVVNLVSEEEDDDNQQRVEFTPFVHCTSTNDVLDVIEKLSGIMRDDNATPAVDIRNVLHLTMQSIKKNILQGQQRYIDSIEKFDANVRVSYAMGENIGKASEKEIEKTNFAFIGGEGENINNYMVEGSKDGITQEAQALLSGKNARGREDFQYDAFLKVRDAYISGIVGQAESFNALLESIGDDKELSACMRKNDGVARSGSFRNREVNTPLTSFRKYVTETEQDFDNAMSRAEIVQKLQAKTPDSMTQRFLQDAEFGSISSDDLGVTSKGLPIVLEWIDGLSEEIMSRERKDSFTRLCSIRLAQEIQAIDQSIHQSIVDIKDDISGTAPINNKEEFDRKREAYRLELRKNQAYLNLDSTTKDYVVDLATIARELKKRWKV